MLPRTRQAQTRGIVLTRDFCTTPHALPPNKVRPGTPNNPRHKSNTRRVIPHEHVFQGSHPHKVPRTPSGSSTRQAARRATARTASQARRLHAHTPGARPQPRGQTDEVYRRKDFFLSSHKNPTIKIPSLMILPQVHLRKPCYDFYFL